MNFLRQGLLTAVIALAIGHAAEHAFAAQALDEVARNVQFSNLSPEDGLSSEFVQDLVQDGRGYIWFATQAGLNRFDGHEVRVYEHDPDDETSLSHTFVWSLHVDDAGVLWIGTEHGINTYDPASDSFDREPFGGAISQMRARKVTQAAGGLFWIGTVGAGLIAIEPVSGDVTRYANRPDEPDSLPHDNVIDIYEDRAGTLWVGTDGGGLARFDRATESFTTFRPEPEDSSSLSDLQVRSIFEDSDGQLWIGTAEGGLNRLDPATGRFTRYTNDPDDPSSVGGGQIPSIYQDIKGTLWIATEDGLSEWRASIDGFVNYRHDPAERRSLINNRVIKITQDASGVLWIATYGGVSRWNYVSDTFQHYRSAEEFLQSDVVTSIAETSGGVLWVGTYGGGLSQLNPDTGDARHYRHDPNDPTTLGDDRVMTVHVDGQDTVWIGTRSAGMDRLDEDGRFTHFRSDAANEASLSGNAVTRIFSDRSGTLWVGTYGSGLNRVHWQRGSPVFERFLHDPQNEDSLSGDRVLAIHEDSGGNLWIGTEGAGLNRFMAGSNSFQRLDVEDVTGSDGSNPVNGTPWELHESVDGTTWIGTLGQGLLRWSAADRIEGRTRFERFGSDDGLAPEIYGIVRGAANELWLSSSRGLFRFDPARDNVRKFDRSNGLPNNEFNHGARLRTQSGRVVFGGTNGLVAFFPDRLPHNARPPSIDLVAKSRTEMLARVGPGAAPRIELGYLDPFVAFEFIALDFMSADKNAYRYQLQGYDGDWNDAQGYRRAIYSNLPAGEYTFEVQGSNSDGVWNREGASIQVRVVPPPWRSIWAYLAYAVVIVWLIVMVLRRQENKRRQEAQLRARLERLVKERTGELAERNGELMQLNQRLKEASVTDQLTGLRNRRYVDEYIEAEVASVQRRHVEVKQPRPDGTVPDSSMLLFLVMIDLDGFKYINDTFGHHAGDKALLEVKQRLVEGSRKSDVVVRWGGDEFLIVGHATSFEGTQVLAEKLRLALAEQPYDVGNGHQARLSGSMGIAAIPFVEDNAEFGAWEQIVAMADHGAYLSKGNGRNAWVSIRGTTLMEERDFHGVKENLENLVDSGKLLIDTSVEGGISLLAAEPPVRSSAG